ncbi:MAG TPA: addiction module antidote protein [Steroidobacter sp.]
MRMPSKRPSRRFVDAGDFVDIARARGMARLAKETGISREGLYEALSPDGNPSLRTVLKW